MSASLSFVCAGQISVTDKKKKEKAKIIHLKGRRVCCGSRFQVSVSDLLTLLVWVNKLIKLGARVQKPYSLQSRERRGTRPVTQLLPTRPNLQKVAQLPWLGTKSSTFKSQAVAWSSITWYSYLYLICSTLEYYSPKKLSPPPTFLSVLQNYIAKISSQCFWIPHLPHVAWLGVLFSMPVSWSFPLFLKN